MRGATSVPALAGVLCLAACGEPPPAPAPAPAAAVLPTFVDVAREAGLDAVNHTGRPGRKDWIVAANGGGAIVLDYDQDGRMDLVVIDGTMLTEKGDLEYDGAWRTRLYHNDGNMHFTDVTAKSGIDLMAMGMGGASCDYDGDGWPDFYVCCWGGNHLFHNKGDGTFEDVTQKAGVGGDEDQWSNGCAWGDVNGDGIPDLYVVNYLDQRKEIEKARRLGRGSWAKWRGVRVYSGPYPLEAQRDRLYLGNGDGTFRDVTDTNLGPQEPVGYGYQAIMTDVDNDGHLDIYVSNDGQPNYLWMNDGHGKFTDRAVVASVATDATGLDQASMGIDAADVNRDGWIDLFSTDLDFRHDTLYVNETPRTGRVHFADRSYAFNVAGPTFRKVSWGTRFLDYDNDGELDLFVACGHVYGEIEKFEEVTGAAYRQSCLLMHNVGPPSYAFEDVTDRGGPALEMRRVWRGAAFADFDDDGDLDVFVTALNDRCALFRNDGGNRNNFLVFRLVGRPPLRDPCGARVTIRLADGRLRMEELHHGASMGCDNDPRLFFGLARETAAKSVEVRWPDGTTQSFADVAARKFYVVEQGRPELREDHR